MSHVPAAAGNETLSARNGRSAHVATSCTRTPRPTRAEPPRPSTRLSTLGDGELTGLAKRRRSEPKRLSALLRGDLDWIVMKCLEKPRPRRYQAVVALEADIRRYLVNEPVEAGPPGAAYRVKKFAQRHVPLLIGTAAVVAVLVAGIIVSTVFAIDAARQRVEGELHKIAEKLYKTESAGSEGMPPNPGADDEGAADDDDVIDAEFTETSSSDSADAKG